MKFTLTLFSFLLMLRVDVVSQNLVPNSSFESYSICPTGSGQISNSLNWFDASWGTVDLYNSCYTTGSVNVDVPDNAFGSQQAYSGSGYAGLITTFFSPPDVNYREYVSVKLIQPLAAGQSYFISFRVSLAENSYYCTDEIQLALTVDSLKSDTSYIIPFTPQLSYSGPIITDKNSWVTVSGSYVANGGEQFLTIGNFHNDLESDTSFCGNGVTFSEITSYFYLDEVCLSMDSVCFVPNGKIEISQRGSSAFYSNGVLYLSDLPVQSTVDFYDSLGRRLFYRENCSGTLTLELPTASKTLILRVSNKNFTSTKKIIQH